MSISTITRALCSRGLTLKNISKTFKLRSLPERETYCVAMLSGLSLNHYFWVDETWFDRRTQVRKRGRSKRGTKAVVNGVFCRGKRQNVFPLLSFPVCTLLTLKILAGDCRNWYRYWCLFFDSGGRDYQYNCHERFCNTFVAGSNNCIPWPAISGILLILVYCTAIRLTVSRL